MMSRQLNRLSARTVTTVTKPGRLADGGNLYCKIDEHRRRWIFRYVRNDRAHELGLGGAATTTLAEARKKAHELRELLAKGIDPLEATRAKPATSKTFGQCARGQVMNLLIFTLLAAIYLVPDPALTPGAIASSLPVCGKTSSMRHWSRARDDAVLARYGLPPGPHPDYEIDHLVPLSLGGADDDTNLWPEPRRSLEPVWNAETKDLLEFRLRDLACEGKLDVPRAQQALETNWDPAVWNRDAL